MLVGFRQGDPDLALVARVLAESGGGPHFLLADANGLEADVLAAELGLSIVACPAGREGIEASFTALAAAWRSVEAGARPAEDDVAGWFEVWRREPTDEEPRAALARAEAALRAERRWDDVVELLLGRVELAPERAEQIATLREVARLYATELDAPDRAFAALEAAFRRDPSADDVRRELERAAAAAGLWGELAADYVEIADDVARDAGPRAAVPHRVALARVQAEELDQLGDAVAEYEAVLTVDDENARRDERARRLAGAAGALGRPRRGAHAGDRARGGRRPGRRAAPPARRPSGGAPRGAGSGDRPLRAHPRRRSGAARGARRRREAHAPHGALG